MVDFVREIDLIGRVTRRRLRDAATMLGELEQELGHQPSQGRDAAKRSGLSVDAYHQLLAHASAAAAMSLERLERDTDEDGNAMTRVAHPRHRGPRAR